MKFVKNLVLSTLVATTGVYLSSAMEIHEDDDNSKAHYFAMDYFDTPEKQRPQTEKLTQAFLALHLRYPLHQAASVNLPQVVRCLITNHHADVNGQDTDGSTALHSVASCYLDKGDRDNSAVVDVLLETNGININIPNRWLETPLHYAASRSKPRIIAKLIQAGAFINARNSRQETPLYIAVFEDEPGNVGVLLSAKADVNIPNKDLNTPLHAAALERNPKIMIQLLQQRNININAQNNDGNTPLHVAVMNNSRRQIEILRADRRINLSIKNKKGLTPMDCRHGELLPIIEPEDTDSGILL